MNEETKIFINTYTEMKSLKYFAFSTVYLKSYRIINQCLQKKRKLASLDKDYENFSQV